MENNKNYNRKLSELKEKVKKIECLKYTLNSIIYWDKITYMPPKGIHYRSKVMGLLGSEIYSLFSDKKLRELVGFFENRKDNDVKVDAMIKRIKRNYIYVNQIPEKEYSDYITLIATAEQVWAEAKADNDFELFAPYLNKIVEFFKGFAEYWGYSEDPYDALIGYYEEGVTAQYIDNLINTIKPQIIKLLAAIKESKVQIEGTSFCTKEKLKKEQQTEFTKKILQEIGFDFFAGRVDEGDHPTVLACSCNDVRLITTYDENDVKSTIYNALHIGGKGLYEQGIGEELLGMLLAEVASFGMEEAVARLYENIIGRKLGFWENMYEKLQKTIPEFEKVPMLDFYRSVNKVESKPIRLDADELTYMLHTIIRYEIERDLICDNISVSDLKGVWSEKYKSYLGVEPKTDSEGILQDVHWAAGYFGYFPSYIFSNVLASQIAKTMEDELGDLETILRMGKFSEINDWLKNNIYSKGAIYSPLELIKKISNEELNAEHYINYLWKKYSEVYEINMK